MHNIAAMKTLLYKVCLFTLKKAKAAPQPLLVFSKMGSAIKSSIGQKGMMDCIREMNKKSKEVKPKHLDRPLVVGCSVGHKTPQLCQAGPQLN